MLSLRFTTDSSKLFKYFKIIHRNDVNGFIDVYRNQTDI